MSGSVVDASIVAAIAFGEPRAGEAAGLVGGALLHAPGLLAYELANVAWKKARREPGLRDAIFDGLELALAMGVRWHPVDHSAVVGLALLTGLSAYDATYLWLSRRLGLPLMTFDGRLRAAAGGA